MNNYTAIFEKYIPDLTEAKTASEVERIGEVSARFFRNKQKYCQLLSNIDLTSLRSTDNNETISAMIEKVNGYDDSFDILPHPAAVCVYSSFVSLVKSELTEDLEIACVAGGFPHSQVCTEVKIAEVGLAVADGASEVDVVIPVGKVMAGEYDEVVEELKEIKAACMGAKLKVIIETSLLRSAELIAKATCLAILGGADFVKTSTGKEGSVASLSAAYVMCSVIKKFNNEEEYNVGFKAAGGIQKAEDAADYLALVSEVLGEDRTTPEYFRIGASSLVNNLLSAINGEEVKYF